AAVDLRGAHAFRPHRAAGAAYGQTGQDQQQDQHHSQDDAALGGPVRKLFHCATPRIATVWVIWRTRGSPLGPIRSSPDRVNTMRTPTTGVTRVSRLSKSTPTPLMGSSAGSSPA